MGITITLLVVWILMAVFVEVAQLSIYYYLNAMDTIFDCMYLWLVWYLNMPAIEFIDDETEYGPEEVECMVQMEQGE
mgnify:CR=1 FL=1